MNIFKSLFPNPPEDEQEEEQNKLLESIFNNPESYEPSDDDKALASKIQEVADQKEYPVNRISSR